MPYSPPSEYEAGKDHNHHLPPPSPQSKVGQRKPGGWKSMPYVLGMESFERLATIGLLANFTVFLMTVFHMTQVSSSYLINIWSGVGNFTPLVGAYISDAYVGKFRVIAFSSFASLLGMMTMTLIVAIPALHPPSCTPQQTHLNQCQGPTTLHMGVLILALGFLSIGSGGIRPCSLPFGVDQFDPTTDEGRKGINSFFNWYYTTFTIILLIALTLVVYIQDSVSWVWGFAIPTILMVCSIVLYFVGTKLYVYVKPEGSVFTGIFQAFVVAYKKRKLKVPDANEIVIDVKFYDPPLKGTYDIPKLPLTDNFRFLNKAAVILNGEITSDGSRVNPWKLASIQQIEEVKCILKVIPVLVSGIICFIAIAQQGTFTISQALKMDRHLGPHFQIPPGSLAVFSMITIGIWLPFYDRILVPSLRKITKIETGITLLQRIGIGVVFSILSMVVAAMVEKMRRESAVHHNQSAPLSVMWLVPQLVLMGFAEAFNIIGQIEFYYKEFPENMKSFANSMFFVTVGMANYFSSALVMVVHKVTGKNGRPDWLTANIDAGRVDYFYYVIAGLGVVNMIYFLIVASRYEYKSKMEISEDESRFDVELNNIKI
ncbi:protein NRT1/ PTR FAMILY 2.13-like [Cynara cardunculus var. scolymus]|uniref:Major facilitator superfamily domain, general substrate transporter n=1 Tax=Cynara cardunculus var. scolymus TaxID=59895 RepID=A0A103YAM0_CYNCS|nr:protein NRT1/ PTR FAMILY 2.13-like [Cynara cardunculus var. scolymus]KVI05588.1 Major facilitator superfamily domain, general substrate transporter [Cynara cardunculus var. scolymus]